MSIPTVTADHLWSVIISNESNNFEEVMKDLDDTQPKIRDYLLGVKDALGEEAAFVGIIVYAMVKNAIDAQYLEESL